jgi:processing peptidase subunit alpha
MSPVVRSSRTATTAATSQMIPPEPQLTTLPNKIRVITGISPQHISTVGIVVDMGSRYESERTSGCGHLMDKLALKV